MTNTELDAIEARAKRARTIPRSTYAPAMGDTLRDIPALIAHIDAQAARIKELEADKEDPASTYSG